MLGLCCYTGFSVVVESGDYSLAVLRGLLIVVASLVVGLALEHVGFSSYQQLWLVGSVIAAPGL